MNLLGHKKQKELLNRMALSGKIPHNLLFTGPESVGKKRAAKEFIKKLNCDNGGCNECRTCKEIDSQRHSDLLVIEGKDEIKIDDVRDLQKRLSLTGKSKESYKAAIIDEAHLLNKQAQSCLLKTLEEPKGNALIILISEHPNTLLDTILSRMWAIKFSLVETDLIENDLVNRGASKSEAKELAKLSFSKPGLAIKLFEDKKFKKDWLKKRDDLQKLRDSYLGERFKYVKSLAKDKEQARETLKVWSSFLRKEMIVSKNKDQALKNKKVLEVIEDVLFLTSKTNVNFKLSLEKVIINL
ncbi:MAG: ATP-binding protein [Patescibacteria group bacterium]